MNQDKHFGIDKDGKKELNPPNFSSWETTKEGLIHFGSKSGPKGVVNKFIDVQDSDKYGKVVRAIDAEGTVLAKNEGGILPLKK